VRLARPITARPDRVAPRKQRIGVGAAARGSPARSAVARSAIGPPCGVPSWLASNSPPCSTPAVRKLRCRGNLVSETVDTRPTVLIPYCETGPALNERSFCDWSRRVFGLVVGQCKQTLDRHLPCGRSLPLIRRDLLDVHDFSRLADRPARLKSALRTEAESKNKWYSLKSAFIASH
jgi:hypothetical protein